MIRGATKIMTLATAALALGVVGVAGPAGAVLNDTASCKGVDVKPVVHNDALRREATLSGLVAELAAHADPYGLNGPQRSALQSADTAIAALDAQIASTCYPTLAALKADATKLFVDYRVYWLRLPQTSVVQAADSLAQARVRLGKAAGKLAPLVSSNATARADLAAMNQALASADAKLGAGSTPGPTIAAAAGLVPAADMTADTAALQAVHADLLTVKAALAGARADGLKVVSDLQN